MNFFPRFLIPVILIAFFYSCKPKEPADLIMYNGVIQTVDSVLSIAEAMVITDGKIVCTGTNQAVKKKYGATVSIDLHGKYVYPGLIDPHSHFTGYALNLVNADLWMTTSMEEIGERLKEHHEKMPSEWLKGRGWDQNNFPDQMMPDNTLLTELFPDIPVFIVRIDGHAALANYEALRIAGINAGTKVEGGEIILNNGTPTGLLIDNAMTLIEKVIPLPTLEQRVELLKRAERNLFEVGLTSVSDAGLDKVDILLIDSLQKAGELDIRVYAMLNPTEENFSHFLKNGPYITDQLTVRSIKHFADGALGSRGALLKKPYTDNPSNYGISVDSPQIMDLTCQLASENGYQMAIHCIGDSAVKLVLDLYSKYLPSENDMRWRIEHAQVVDPVDFPKFANHNIIPSIQTIHAVSDMDWAEDRVGPLRIRGAYAWRDLMDQAGWLPNGSDFPVEQINPLLSYHAAFTRTEKNGEPKGGWYPAQLLTREEALRGMTIWAAMANFEENTRGTLEAGKNADFIILPEDLLSVDPSMIYDMKVQETWLSGKRVF